MPVKRVKRSDLPDAFSIFQDFLNKGRPASVAEYTKFVLNAKHFLQFLPDNQGRFTSALLDGLQLEYFAQAMTLQSFIVTHLVDCFGFSRGFTRLSMANLDSPEECMARLPTDEARASLAALMESQERVFAFNISLMDCTSTMFLVSVQLLHRCGGFPSLRASQDPISVEAAKMMAYDLVGLAAFIKQLADFAALIGIAGDMEQRLLQVPVVPKIFTELAPPGSSLRPSFVKSHRMALNGLVTPFLRFWMLSPLPCLTMLRDRSSSFAQSPCWIARPPCRSSTGCSGRCRTARPFSSTPPSTPRDSPCCAPAALPRNRPTTWSLCRASSTSWTSSGTRPTS